MQKVLLECKLGFETKSGSNKKPNRSETINSGTGRNRTQKRSELDRTEQRRVRKEQAEPRPTGTNNCPEPKRMEPNRFLPAKCVWRSMPDFETHVRHGGSKALEPLGFGAHRGINERLAEYGWKPHRDFLAQQKNNNRPHSTGICVNNTGLAVNPPLHFFISCL